MSALALKQAELKKVMDQLAALDRDLRVGATLGGLQGIVGGMKICMPSLASSGPGSGPLFHG
jgi:hypothetical protein